MVFLHDHINHVSASQFGLVGLLSSNEVQFLAYMFLSEFVPL